MLAQPMSDAATRFTFSAGDNINGILLMVVARMIFAVSDSFTKLTGEGALPPTQVLSLRNAVALPIVLLMAWWLGGLGHIGTAIRNRTLVWRSIIEGVGLLTFVIALPHVTLGQSTVLLLTMPIILVALSALIFKEDVGWRRWTAIVVGFAGVFMVAGPLGGTPNYYLALTMVTAITWAVRDLITSRIVGHIPSVTVTLFATLAGLAVSIPGAAVEEWRPVGATDALYLLAAGSFVALANFLYISALRTGAVSVVAPFRYTGAVWGILLGFLIWGDIPDLWGFVGTFFIIGSGLYTFFRELELARSGRPAPEPARAQ
jgi:drug/metabolite transporter (DMT)-like permease